MSQAEAHHAPNVPLACEEVIRSAEAQAYRAIITGLQDAAARYLPGELSKDKFINAVLEAIDGPAWREAENNRG